MQISPHLVYLMPPNRARFPYKIGGEGNMGSILSCKGYGAMVWFAQYTLKGPDFTTGAIRKRLVRQYQHSCPQRYLSQS
jgi:hypothetical protein